MGDLKPGLFCINAEWKWKNTARRVAEGHWYSESEKERKAGRHSSFQKATSSAFDVEIVQLPRTMKDIPNH